MQKLNLPIVSILIVMLFCFAQCKKNPVAKTELEKLPPVTQIGAYTFGCLLNGIAYIPGSPSPIDNILSVSYDPTFQGGQFIIKTKNIQDLNNKVYINLHADGISTVGIYQIGLKSNYWINFDSNNCTYSNYYETPISGILTITKFDISTRIVSGLFSFKFTNANCGIVEATEGRFDVKY